MFEPTRNDLMHATTQSLYLDIYDLHHTRIQFIAFHQYVNGDRSAELLEYLGEIEENISGNLDDLSSDRLDHLIDVIERRMSDKVDDVNILTSSPFADVESIVTKIDTIIAQHEASDDSAEPEEAEEVTDFPVGLVLIIFSAVVAALILSRI